MPLDREHFRSDIVLGNEALRMATDSFGVQGAPNAEAILNRAAIIYRWLLSEQKR